MLFLAVAAAIIAYFRSDDSSRQFDRPVPRIDRSAERPAPRAETTSAQEPRVDASTARSPNGRRGVVTRVSDGDTIRVRFDDGEKPVRLLGVDAPEIDGPYRKAEPGGNEARNFLRSLIESKQIVVTTDDTAGRDPHGRILGYVHLEDGRFVNLEMIRAGHARVYRKFRFRERERMLAAER
jgi:endonuclease YncB( thermonuclease family)